MTSRSAKGRGVVVAKGKKITEGLYNQLVKGGVHEIRMALEGLEGAISLSEVINQETGEILVESNSEANLSKGNSNFASAEWTSSNAPGLGSTYKVLAKMSGGKNAGLFEITQWDPPQRYSYKSISGLPFPIESIESAVTLAPKANGTQITFESQFGLVGILRFAEGMFSKLATKGDGDNFDTAKRLLEAN